MTQKTGRFRHESLQDQESIEALLKAITKGVAKGKLTFSDEDDELVLEPKGLLHLKVTASKEEMGNRLNIRISWRSDDALPEKKPLKIS